MRPSLEITKDYLTVTAKATELGMSPDQLRRRIQRGLIECDRVVHRYGETLYLWKK